jgi:hypothetical protein
MKPKTLKIVSIGLISVLSIHSAMGSTQASNQAAGSMVCGSALIGIGSAYASKAVIEVSLRAFAVPVYLSGAAFEEVGASSQSVAQDIWDATGDDSVCRPARNKRLNQKRLEHYQSTQKTLEREYRQ